VGRARLLQAGGVIVVVMATVLAALVLRPGHGAGTDRVRAVDTPGSAPAATASAPSRSATQTLPRRPRLRSGSPDAVTSAPAVTPAPPPQPTQSSAPAPPPAALTLRVTVSKRVVHYGERVRVTYDWSDGDGDVIDVNQLGFGAFRALRDVPCKHDPEVAHPISRHGSFWWSPVAALLPPDLTDKIRVAVGFNVRTGGCAHIQERTVTHTVTVLPTVVPTGPPSAPVPPDVEIG
jgi:hypothetical protein